MNQQETIDQITESYRKTISTFKEALLEAGVSKRETYFYLFHTPDIEDVIPEDMVRFYEQVRKMVIIYLRQVGFSQREISRRLGGSSYHIVTEVLKDKSSETKGGEDEHDTGTVPQEPAE